MDLPDLDMWNIVKFSAMTRMPLNAMAGLAQLFTPPVQDKDAVVPI
jgi:hypothetical protein